MIGVIVGMFSGCRYQRGPTPIFAPPELLPSSTTLSADQDGLEIDSLSEEILPSDVMVEMANPVLNGDAQRTGTVALLLEEAIRTAIQNSAAVRTIAGDNTIADSTVFDPPIVDTGVQAAWGVFNPVLDIDSAWERIDRPPGRTEQGAFLERNQLDLADVHASLAQPLFSGGEVAADFDTRYSFFPPGDGPINFLNPQYFPQATFRFDQPLLQGYGWEVNTAPIVIASTRADQSAWQFKQAMMAMVRSVEQAYWEVYASQVEVEALKEVIPMFEEVVRINRAHVQLQLGAEVDADQAETQLWLFRRELLEAELRRQDRINLLRNVVGFPPTDRREIRLETGPFKGGVSVDWMATLAITMQERPDIMRQRLSVRVRELEQLIAYNARRVRLDGFGHWQIDGLSKELGRALTVLGDNDFTTWQLGFRFNVPLGRDTKTAELRAANLEIRRETVLLQQTIHSATHDLANIVRTLYSYQQQYQVVRQEVEYAHQWRDGAGSRYFHPAAGLSRLAALNNYLSSLRRWAQAKALAADILGRYNVLLVRLEEAKGTLLEERSIELSFDCCRMATRMLPTAAEEFLLDRSDLDITEYDSGAQGEILPLPEPNLP